MRKKSSEDLEGTVNIFSEENSDYRSYFFYCFHNLCCSNMTVICHQWQICGTRVSWSLPLDQNFFVLMQFSGKKSGQIGCPLRGLRPLLEILDPSIFILITDGAGVVYPRGPMLVSKGSRLEIVCRFLTTGDEKKPTVGGETGSSQPVWFGPDGRLISQLTLHRYSNLRTIYTGRKRKNCFLAISTFRFRKNCFSYIRCN